MAQIAKLNDEEWAVWLAEHEEVRALAERLPPDRLYRMKSTGQRVALISYGEDDTLRVWVGGQFNLLTFEREVFGVKADDLEECDLPTADETLGVMIA